MAVRTSCVLLLCRGDAGLTESSKLEAKFFYLRAGRETIWKNRGLQII